MHREYDNKQDPLYIHMFIKCAYSCSQPVGQLYTYKLFNISELLNTLDSLLGSQLFKMTVVYIWFILQLEFLCEMRLTWQQCAIILLLSRTTLWRWCQELNLALHNTNFSNIIIDDELDSVMHMLVECYPRSGSVMMLGYLHGFGIQVLQRRVCEPLIQISRIEIINCSCSNSWWDGRTIHFVQKMD